MNQNQHLSLGQKKKKKKEKQNQSNPSLNLYRSSDYNFKKIYSHLSLKSKL